MARTSKKNVYERIEEQQNKILETEKLLEILNEELELLYKEKDDLEMRQLLQQMKDSNLDIETALNRLINNIN